MYPHIRIYSQKSIQCVSCIEDIKNDNKFCCENVCNQCQMDWNICRFNETSDKAPDSFECLSCRNKQNIAQTLSIFDQEEQQKIGQKLALQSFKNDKSIINCPKQGCDYYAFINNDSLNCCSPFQCEQCENLFILPQQAKKTLSTHFHEFFTALRTIIIKLIISKRCPNKKCGKRIQKNGGCSHMRCVSCLNEFCWFCLKIYDSYGRHNDALCFAQLITPYVALAMIVGYYLNLHYWIYLALKYVWINVLCINIQMIVMVFAIFNSIDLISQLIEKYKRRPSIKIQSLMNVAALILIVICHYSNQYTWGESYGIWSILDYMMKEACVLLAIYGVIQAGIHIYNRKQQQRKECYKKLF